MKIKYEPKRWKELDGKPVIPISIDKELAKKLQKELVRRKKKAKQKTYRLK